MRAVAAGRISRPRRSPGISLLEVVLATVVASVFIAAFLAMFGVQQQSFRALEDETSAPVAGANLLSLMFGPTGMLNTAPTTALKNANDLLLEPADVSLAIFPPGTDTWRAIAFVPDPAASSMPLGTIAVQDQNGTLTDLAPPNSVATMSFFFPDLVSAPGLVAYPLTTLNGPAGPGTPANVTVGSTTGMAKGETLAIDNPPNQELVTILTVVSSTSFKANLATNHPNGAPVGQLAFYILGATALQGDYPGLPKALALKFQQVSSGTWQFQWPSTTGASSSYSFSPGQMFTLDGELQHDGKLICAFPAIDATLMSAQAVPLTLNDPVIPGLHRLGVWLQMNSSPMAGLQILRDELYLRN